MALVWPLPALAVWAVCWAVFAAIGGLGSNATPALLVASSLGALLAIIGSTPWRRLFIGVGFPLSALALGAAFQPAWAWLLPLGLLALVYPVRTWGDAPLFPTPRGALRGLAGAAPLPAGASILDAGCGLGAGLLELHREYPRARPHGTEWSWPLSLACSLRCRFAVVRRGDLWADDWSPHALVYLFQRPESMARAVAKARRELKPGAWLASLEFAAQELMPDRCLDDPGGRRVWLYQAPFRSGS